MPGKIDPGTFGVYYYCEIRQTQKNQPVAEWYVTQDFFTMKLILWFSHKAKKLHVFQSVQQWNLFKAK